MFFSSGCVGGEVVYSAPESLIILVNATTFINNDCYHHFLIVWGYSLLAFENNVFSPLSFLVSLQATWLQIKIHYFKGTKPTFCFLHFTFKLFLFLTHHNLKTAPKFNKNLLWHKWNWMYLYKQSMFIHLSKLRKIKEISTTTGLF